MALFTHKKIPSSFALLLLGVLLMLAGISAPSQGAALRLMPLGDSITSGYLSSTNNGYRAGLYNALVSQGHRIDFVGSLRDGDTFDPDHEGHSGYRIDQISALLNAALAVYQPNVVTLHVGTNDMLQSYQLSTAPNRLASLIDQILANDPGVTVVVAQLIVNADSATQSRINAYNSQIPGIVQARANAGKHVYMVSMGSLNTGDLKDGTHPNDGGYQKMANNWDGAVQQVISYGWVTNIAWAGVYSIQNVSSGQVIDVSGGSYSNNAPVIQWTYKGGRNQMWNFIPTSNGYYQIKNANSGLDVAVTNASTSYGAPIIQWQYGGAGNDQWFPTLNSDGTTSFYNRNSGLALDMPGLSQTQGTQFDQWGGDGGSNQKFRVTAR